MTSESCYKVPFKKEHAVEELKKYSGTHFDPKVIVVFVNNVLPYESDFQIGY